MINTHISRKYAYVLKKPMFDNLKIYNKFKIHTHTHIYNLFRGYLKNLEIVLLEIFPLFESECRISLQIDFYFFYLITLINFFINI